MTYQKIVDETYRILTQNKTEWEPRYAGYTQTFTPSKISINLPKTLKKYTSISIATKAKQFCDLRYQGQHIANLVKINGNHFLQIDNDTATNNSKHLTNCINILKTPTTGNGIPWISQDGTDIRKFFEADYGKSGHEEHTLESLFLTELSKKNSTDKSLLNIQPITFDGKRLQIATTLKASKIYNFFSPRNTKSLQQLLRYSGPKGGGIDILARRRNGNKTYLTVIELKDKYAPNEKPTKSIGQAIAYATFIATLIKSNAANGAEWYKKFGFKQTVPDKLKIYATIAMPNIPKNIEQETQTEFDKCNKLTIPNINAEIVLHYLNLDNNAKVISTSKGF